LSTRPLLRGLWTAGFGPPFFALVGIVAVFWTTMSRAEECTESPRMHALDFWLGRWDVSQGGRLAGTNTIETTLDGCAIFEHWRDVEGGRGTSLFYYDRGTARWKQVWVTEHALAVGGAKEKIEQVELTATGRIRFQGQYPAAEPGTILTDRTTLTRHEDGTVRQVIEISKDAGRTWHTAFDAIYHAAIRSACSTSPDSVAAAPRALVENDNRRDLEGVLAGYTDDAVWLSPDQGVVRRSAFRARYESVFRDNRLAYAAEITEAGASGFLGFVRGRIGGTITPLDGTPPRSINDTFLALTRCEAGRWRVSHLMWSHR
jgi:ketosteroid isomerase-like protein